MNASPALFPSCILWSLLLLPFSAGEPLQIEATRQPYLSGHWVSNDYRCGDFLYTEEIVIHRRGDSYVARKISGDPCVPAGNISFQTQAVFHPGQVVPIVWTSGRPERPAGSRNKGSLQLLNGNRLVVHFDPKLLLFVRKESGASGPAHGFRALRRDLAQWLR